MPRELILRVSQCNAYMSDTEAKVVMYYPCHFVLGHCNINFLRANFGDAFRFRQC